MMNENEIRKQITDENLSNVTGGDLNKIVKEVGQESDAMSFVDPLDFISSRPDRQHTIAKPEKIRKYNGNGIGGLSGKKRV